MTGPAKKVPTPRAASLAEPATVLSTPRQLGAIMTARRRTRSLTQAELGAALGVGQARLSVLESNPERMTLAQLLTLVSVLGLEVRVAERASERAADRVVDGTPAW